MPQIQRVGDVNTAGAPIISTLQTTVFVNNKLVSVNGSYVQGHGVASHSSPITSGGSPNVYISNIPVNRTGDADSCGHLRVGGSPDVFVN